MTKSEAKDILINRLDFRVEGSSPVSGRFFESEHAIIELNTIRECQPTPNISDEDFTKYLTDLKTDVVFELLSSVFDSDTINDNVLECYPSAFDNCLSLLMAIRLINLFVTSQRSNRTQRISKSVAQQIHFDLNGNYGRDMNPNFPRAYGIATKYRDELRKLRNKLFKQRKFKTITVGAGGAFPSKTISNSLNNDLDGIGFLIID